MLCSCCCELSHSRKESFLTYPEEEENVGQGWHLMGCHSKSNAHILFRDSEDMHGIRKPKSFPEHLTSICLLTQRYVGSFILNTYISNYGIFPPLGVSIGEQFLEESSKTLLCWVNICIVSPQMCLVLV